MCRARACLCSQPLRANGRGRRCIRRGRREYGDCAREAFAFAAPGLAASSIDGARHGPLIAHSARPLVDAAACAGVITECEERAARLGGWTTERHENYPTTDVPVQKLPRTLRWFREVGTSRG